MLEKGAEPEKMDVIMEHLKDQSANHYKDEEQVDRRSLNKHLNSQSDILASHLGIYKEETDGKRYTEHQSCQEKADVEVIQDPESTVNTPTGIDGLHITMLDNQLRHILRPSTNINTDHLLHMKKLCSPRESAGRKLPAIPSLPMTNKVNFLEVEDIRPLSEEQHEPETLEAHLTADQKSPDEESNENMIHIDDEKFVGEQGPQISIPDATEDQDDAHNDDDCDNVRVIKNVEFTIRTDYAIEEDVPTNIYADEIATRAAPYTMFSQFNMSMMPSSEENSEQSDRWETPAVIRPKALNIKPEEPLDIGMEYLTPPENMPNVITPVKGDIATPIIKGGSLRDTIRNTAHQEETLRASSLREDMVKNVREAVLNISRILPGVEGVARRFGMKSEEEKVEAKTGEIKTIVENNLKPVKKEEQKPGTETKIRNEEKEQGSIKLVSTPESPTIEITPVKSKSEYIDLETAPDIVKNMVDGQDEKRKALAMKNSSSSKDNNSSVFSTIKRFASPYKSNPRKAVKDYSLRKDVLELENGLSNNSQKETNLEERGSADGASPRMIEDPKTHDSLQQVADRLDHYTYLYPDEKSALLHQRHISTGPSDDTLEHLYDTTASFINSGHPLRGSVDTMWSAIEMECLSSLPRPPRSMKTRKSLASSAVR